MQFFNLEFNPAAPSSVVEQPDDCNCRRGDAPGGGRPPQDDAGPGGPGRTHRAHGAHSTLHAVTPRPQRTADPSAIAGAALREADEAASVEVAAASPARCRACPPRWWNSAALRASASAVAA